MGKTNQYQATNKHKIILTIIVIYVMSDYSTTLLMVIFHPSAKLILIPARINNHMPSKV